MNSMDVIMKIAGALGLDFLSRNKIKFEKNIDSNQKAVESIFLPTIEALGDYKKKKTLELIESGCFSPEQAEKVALNEIQIMNESLQRQKKHWNGIFSIY
ncbi:MAG: hypothetical protein Q4G28_10380 [Neisseria sp.]|nr:hypothetical protein [Neisseria sp.]